MILGLSPLEFAVAVVALVSTVLGLLVGYQAYRGFRRNDSPRMRYISAGLILLTAIPYTVSFVGTLLIRLDLLAAAMRSPIGLVARLVQLCGLVCLVYALYAR